MASISLEKASIIINFLSGVVIAALAVYLTYTNNQHQAALGAKQTQLAETQAKLATEQSDVAKMQTLATFLPYIREAKSEEEKDYAILKIKEFMPKEIPQLAKVYPNQKAIKVAADKVFAQITDKTKKVYSPPSPILNKEGWIYLGEFEDGFWRKSYISVTSSQNPEKLRGEKISVKSGHKLNVREGTPNTFGKMASVIDVIDDTNTIEIEKVEEWYSTGFMWAKIKY